MKPAPITATAVDKATGKFRSRSGLGAPVGMGYEYLDGRKEDKIKAAGGNVTREAGPVKGGSTVIAFVTDPDGYKIELIQRADDAGAGQGLRG